MSQGVHLREEEDLLAVNGDGAVVILDGTIITAVHGVILEHIRHVVGGHERVVDRDELNVRVGKPHAENHAADAAKAIDANFDSHNFVAS